MSAPPPPPPRRARGPVDPAAPAPANPPAAPSPAPPPPRRAAPPAAPVGPPPATVGATAVTPTGPTRAERRAAEQAARGKKPKKASNGDGRGGGGRKGLLIGIAVVLVLALAAGGAFAAGVFSSGGGGGSDELEASTNVNLEAGEVKVRWPGLGPGQADPDLPNQIMTALGKYVDDGIVPALRAGQVKEAGLQELFDLGALAQLQGEPRGTLFDEGQPKAIGKLTITAPPVEIIALNDVGNVTVLATAKLDLNLRVRSAKGYYTIRHDGQIVLVPDAGTWKITGWDVQVERSTPTVRPPWVTTTTAAEKTG